MVNIFKILHFLNVNITNINYNLGLGHGCPSGFLKYVEMIVPTLFLDCNAYCFDLYLFFLPFLIPCYFPGKACIR